MKAKPSVDGSKRVDVLVLACGYNNHVGTDRCHGQIRALTATGAVRHARADGGSALIGDEDRPVTDRAHVFEPSGGVQAGLFVVRNFRKDGRGPVLPPIERSAGPNDVDMLFAVEALDRGYSVVCCQNIRLSKLGSSEPSDASDGAGPAGAGRNERIAEPTAQHDPATKPASRSLDLGQLYAARWDGKEAPVRVPKP